MPKNKPDGPSSLFAPPPDAESTEVVQEPPKPDSETTQLLRVVLTDEEIREKSRALADKAMEMQMRLPIAEIEAGEEFARENPE